MVLEWKALLFHGWSAQKLGWWIAPGEDTLRTPEDIHSFRARSFYVQKHLKMLSSANNVFIMIEIV